MEMQINSLNYESWMLSYIDGELDAREEGELMAFLEAHPSLREELQELESLKVHPDPDIVFEKRNILYPAGPGKWVRLWWIPAAAAALVLWALVARKVPVLNSRPGAQGLVFHLQGHPSRISGPAHPAPPILPGNPVQVSRHALASVHPVSPSSVPFRIHRSLHHSDSVSSGPVSTSGSKEISSNRSAVAYSPVPPLPRSGVPAIRGNLVALVLEAPVSRPAIAMRIPPSGTAPASLPENQKLILSIQGKSGVSLISRIARIQKFFSRKNPVLAKTDIVQVGPIEFVKPN